MSGETDLIKLYSTRILALASDIPNLGRLSDPDGSAKCRSPQCGSAVTVDVQLQEDRITAIGLDVKACALGQAAAAVTSKGVIGLTLAEVEAARDALFGMLKEGKPTPGAPFEEFEVLTPAIAFANRHASILLSLNATVQAVADALQQPSIVRV